jgi:hypothetical protein
MEDIGMNITKEPTTILHATGFAAAAEFLASDADRESFIFRKFSRLAARNLLDMQNELKYLEREQEKLDREVTLSKDDVLCSAARNYDDFMENLASHQGLQKRKDLQNEIDCRLEKYCMFLQHVDLRKT